MKNPRRAATKTSRPKIANAAVRRRTKIADTAIKILAEEGARALSHRAIDRAADLPEGSTSNFFKSRKDILVAACDRIVDLDLSDLEHFSHDADAARSLREEMERVASILVVMMAPRNQNRARARLELYLAATRDPAILQIFTSRWRRRFAEFTERRLIASTRNPPARTMEIYRALLTGFLMRSALEPGGVKDPNEVRKMMTNLIPLFRVVDRRGI